MSGKDCQQGNCPDQSVGVTAISATVAYSQVPHSSQTFHYLLCHNAFNSFILVRFRNALIFLLTYLLS